MTDLIGRSVSALVTQPLAEAERRLLAHWDGAPEDMAALVMEIEAAAIARDREALVEVVARYIHEARQALHIKCPHDHNEAGLNQCLRDARRLLALDAPVAQG